MTLSVAGIGRRKIGGPLGAGQPERLAHGPLGERGDPRGVEHATFAVQRMQAHEPFDLAGYDRHARPGGLSAPHDLARRLADERRLVERPLAGDHELRFGEGGIESHSGQNPLRAARELGLGEIREPRAQSARGTAPPAAPRTAQPSPRAAPVPPSTVADPPRPTTTVFAPRSTASQISSPTPRDVARSGSSCSGLRSAIPQAVALSKIAVSGSTQPSSPDTDSPKGPATVMRSRNEPRGRTASRSPSPPSEIGSWRTAASGRARRAPSARASAT